MGKVKILHCADIHIGANESFLGEKAESRRFETLMTFERAVDLAKEQGVQAVALAGDIFHSNEIEKSFVQAVMAKIAEAADIKFIFAAGNHDPLDSRSPFLCKDLPENLYVLPTNDTCITFDDIGLCVYGRSFESAFLKGEETFSLEAKNKDYVNLMVQHGELKSDLNSQYNAITRRFIEESGMDYIALGHIHKRTDIGKIGKTYFAYSGCAEGQGFDENDSKGVLLGSIGDGQCELEFVPIAKRMHITEEIDVSLCDSGEISDKILCDLKDKYGENYGDNLYKIRLTGRVAAESKISAAEICSRISDKVYFAKVKDCTEPDFDLEMLAKETSLKGIFVKKCLERIQACEDDIQKKALHDALVLGIKAFESEVAFVED